MASEENSGVSALASRFEKKVETSEPAAKITNIASRFEQAKSSATKTSAKPKAAVAPAAGGASVIAARNAPVKKTEEAASAPSVMDVAARFRAGEKTAEQAESSFSNAKGTFLKGESAVRSIDGESKVMAAASMFGDTIATAGAAGLPRKSVDRKEAPPVKAPSKVSEENVPGFSKASSVFSGSAPAMNAAAEDSGPSQSERFADAARMFGGTK